MNPITNIQIKRIVKIKKIKKKEILMMNSPPSHGVSSGLQPINHKPINTHNSKHQIDYQKHKKINFFLEITQKSLRSIAWCCYPVELHWCQQEDPDASSWNPSSASFSMELTSLSLSRAFSLLFLGERREGDGWGEGKSSPQFSAVFLSNFGVFKWEGNIMAF